MSVGAAVVTSSWHGQFKYEYPRDPIEYPTSALLAFSAGRIIGHGRDEDGSFTIEGVYDTTNGRTSWRKVYLRGDGSSTVIAFAGLWHQQSNSIEGKWRIVNELAFGTFVLRPGDGIAAAASMAARTKEATGPVKSTLNRDLLVFDGERAMLSLLETDPHFVEARTNAARAASGSSRERRSLLLSGLRLTPRLQPMIFNVVDECVRKLGITDPVESYCFPDPMMQAFVIREGSGKVLLGFSSGLIERLDEDELTFVVGHELGHAIYGHLAISGESLRKDDRINPSTILRLFAYKRYAEITADRVGLLCCDDLGVAIRALFKVTSGLSNARSVRDASEFTAQFQDLRATTQKSEASDWLSTHPYSPLRLEALSLFARSQTFQTLQGRTGGELSEEHLEREVGLIVGMMNPSVMFEGPSQREALLFFAMAALEVATADGVIDPREHQHLLDIRSKITDERDAMWIASMTPEERQVHMAELSDKLIHTMSRVQCARMIEDLTAIAAADGRIDKSEVRTLAGAAAVLDVDTRVVIEAIERYQRPLD
ncbi:MAG: M48 family metallopeptidase [Deltaproteobacteria bacterium]|nr:M48 family metallopeptidase [Deltaproteobacteria bacterium]